MDPSERYFRANGSTKSAVAAKLFERAKRLFMVRKYAAAGRLYAKSASEDPGFSAAHQDWALCLEISGKHSEAERIARKAVELTPEPDRCDAYALAGLIAESLHGAAVAREWYEKAVQSNLYCNAARERINHLFRVSDRIGVPRKISRAALDVFVSSFKTKGGQTLARRMAEDRKLAGDGSEEAEFERSSRAERLERKALFFERWNMPNSAADVWLAFGDRKRAEKCIAVCEAYSSPAEAAREWLDLGERAKAAAAYEREGQFYYVLAAEQWIAAGKPKNAARCADEAKREGSYPSAAKIWLELGDKDRASRCNELCEKDGLYCDAAEIWIDLGRKALAAACADKCERKGEDLDAAYIWLNLGAAHRKDAARCAERLAKGFDYSAIRIWLFLKDRGKAERFADEFLRVTGNPVDPDLLLMLGRKEEAASVLESEGSVFLKSAADLWFGLGNVSAAERCARRCEHEKRYLTAAYVWLKLGRRDMVEHCAELCENDLASWYDLPEIYYWLGERERSDAIMDFNELLEASLFDKYARPLGQSGSR